MDDFYKDESIAKVASNSLQALKMIMQVIQEGNKDFVCPDYQGFLRLINDPKFAEIKKILDSTKEEVIRSGMNRLELREEIQKRSNPNKEIK